MASTKQREAARENIKKARQAWQAMSSRRRALAQPEGRGREQPATKGEGQFFHIEVRPKAEFKTFRTHDVGKRGGIERVSGKRASGSWSTQKWLISKEHAHMRDGRLIADSEDAQHLLDTLGSQPVHVRGDRFEAKDRPNVPEKDKPTSGQKRARRRNIGKAQEARYKRAAAQ